MLVDYVITLALLSDLNITMAALFNLSSILLWLEAYEPLRWA